MDVNKHGIMSNKKNNFNMYLNSISLNKRWLNIGKNESNFIKIMKKEMVFCLLLWAELGAGDDPATSGISYRRPIWDTRMLDTCGSNIIRQYKQKLILDDLMCVGTGVMSYLLGCNVLVFGENCIDRRHQGQ